MVSLKQSLHRVQAVFKPRPNRFLERLGEQAVLSVSALDALIAYMDEPTAAHARRIHELEQEADEVRRILIDELNHTFATPIDRQDIFALSRAIDDVVDYADSTIMEMDVLSVKPNSYLRQMANVLRDAAAEIRLAMDRLDKNPAVATEHAIKAKAFENGMESIYRASIADLFSGSKSNDQIVEMLKLREIYRHMSNAADRGDEAANIISDIIVKMT